ncbi:acyltransferase family protein [Microbacterium sp. NPDC096154]|uniref:acyltransferase family protein n=1 Tax=Microbacterium sp. NPDC096154 TaxID=3155549 RepID=UPI00331F9852
MTSQDLRTGAARGLPATRSLRIAEIDGLRGIALTLVVLFHLFGQGRVSGGVDVFLFVTGVVLTLSLAGDVRRGTQGRVLERWTRGFGRLAPPAAIVLLAIVAMAVTVLPPWTRAQTLVEAASAALYLENWQLIRSQLAYGAAGPLTSPVQHFWSLSIQGQFLLAAPLLVAIAYGARRVLRRPGGVLWTLAVVATVASFGYAAAQNHTHPQAAYFDTLARAWELGAGVLVAGAILRGIRVSGPWASLAAGAGIVAVLGSGFVIDGAAAYPGPAALLPVAGAALIVLACAPGPVAGGAAASPAPSIVRRLLRSRPLGALNRHSYALYLWHWPVLILFLALSGQTVADALGAAVVLVASGVLAVATQRLVERPVGAWLRGGRPLRRAPAVLTATLLVPALVVGMTASDASRPSVAAGSCQGAAALDPERPECADAVAAELAAGHAPIPALDELTADDDNRPECWTGLGESELRICPLGPDDATLRILAVGDSHSNTLLGVYERIAHERGWRIEAAGRAGCHWTHAERRQNEPADVAACARWNDALDAHVAAHDYDAILVTHSSRARYTPPAGISEDDHAVEGLVSAWATRTDPATPVIAIRDNPVFPLERMSCLQHAERVAAGECALPRAEALRPDGLAEAVSRDPHAHLIDLTHLMCTADACPLVVGGAILVRDGSHLTATFARTLTPYLDRELARLLADVESERNP